MSHAVPPPTASAAGAWGGTCRSAIVLHRDLAAQACWTTTGTLLDRLGLHVVVLQLAVPAQEPLTLVSLHARPARYDGDLQADQSDGGAGRPPYLHERGSGLPTGGRFRTSATRVSSTVPDDASPRGRAQPWTGRKTPPPSHD